MPLIKPRTRGKQLVRHRTRLDRENNETLYAYSQMIGESTEYVLNQVIDTKLAKDKEFVRWRVTHPDSYVPKPSRRLSNTKVRSRQHDPGPGPSVDARMAHSTS